MKLTKAQEQAAWKAFVTSQGIEADTTWDLDAFGRDMWLIYLAATERMQDEADKIAAGVLHDLKTADERAKELEAENAKLQKVIEAIDDLRKPEGAAVTICCDNPEGMGPDNCAIYVNDDWTNDLDYRFEAPTVAQCLHDAINARNAVLKAGIDQREANKEKSLDV